MRVELLVSHWCPTCPAAEAIWRQVAAERAIDFAVVDVSKPEGREIVSKLNLRTVPSTVIDGVLQGVGVQSLDEARALVAAAPPRAVARPEPRREAAAAAPPLGARAAFRLLANVPHRFFFLLGAVQAVAVMLWWLVDLGGRYAGVYAPIAWTVPPPWAHAFLLNYTVFPFFILGFLMTAMPNWTGEAMPHRAHLYAGLPMAIGVVLVYVGLATDARLVLAGVASHVVGWLIGVGTLASVVAANRGRDRFALGVTAALGVGALSAAAFGAWLATDEPAYAAISRHAGVWLFLVPLFLTVEHRLVPFFSSRIIEGYVVFRPQWSIPLLVAASALHFALELAGARGWLWVADAPMAAWVATLAVKWGLKGSFRARLLVMLHLALVALAVALALYTLDSLATAAGHAGALGLAPLHALTIGYFAATTLAMVSRVSLGHSGRALEADPLTWWAFVGVLATAGVRATADLWFVPPTLRLWLSVLAAVLWLAVFVPWAARYVPIYLRPRGDGRPG
jgi:uncharacterized protein involved in response to NO